MSSDSILTSTKQVLGIVEADESFDLDIITFINSSFNTLSDLGMGPQAGFYISDKTATWDNFIANDNRVQSAKTYIYLAVRLLFDPPQSQSVLSSMKETKSEMEWRIVHRQDMTDWRPANPPPTDQHLDPFDD